MAVVGKNVWILENMAVFQNDEWSNLESEEKIYLRIHEEMGFVLTGDRLVYRLKFTDLMRGIAKNGKILITFPLQGSMTKIGMKIVDTGNDDRAHLVRTLAFFFPVETQDDQAETQTETKEIKQQFQNELNRLPNFHDSQEGGSPFPSGPELERFLKDCILDPRFPNMVDEVEKTLHKYLY